MSEPRRKAPTASKPASRAGHIRETRSRLLRRIGDFSHDVHTRPLIDYYMILIVVVFLTGLGIVMVFSSSMTWSVIDGNSVWATATRQSFMVAAGVIAMWLAMRVKPATLQLWAPWILVLALALLVAVLIPGIGTGMEEVGSQSWIALGPLRLQPSEIAKVAIAVWGANYLTAGGQSKPDTRRFGIFAGVAGLMLILIFLEHDVGMAMTFFIMVALVSFFAGIDIKWVIGAVLVAALGVIGLASMGGFRSHRFTVYFDALFGHFEDTRGISFQSYQGFLSLADGSATGVGLGQSRAKWFYLPEAKNDFIFAIVGEELGLWGGFFVIAAFAALGYYGFRCATHSQNKFMGLMAASLTAGVVVQAFINIGYVIGLLPVTGIQLPMISAGGTSAIITLGSMGLLASCARYEPEAISAMQSYGRPVVDRLLGFKEPDARDVDMRSPRPKVSTRPKSAVPVTQRPAGYRDRDGSVKRDNPRLERGAGRQSTQSARPARRGSQDFDRPRRNY